MSNWLNKYFSAVVRYLGVDLPMRGIVEVVGSVVAADVTLEDGTKVTRLSFLPNFSGDITIGNYTKTTTTSADGKVVVQDIIVSFQTTDGTALVDAYTFELPNGGVSTIDVCATAIRSDLVEAAVYKRAITFRRNGGTIGTVGVERSNTTDENNAGWNCQAFYSGTNGKVRVTGASGATIRWGLCIRVQTTVP